MEIIKVTPRGYCQGVVRAITIAKETAAAYPNQNIYILGMLVHNQYVMKALEALRIQSVDDKRKKRIDLLDDIEEGVVIFTAHGISEDVMRKAEKKGLICVDASCPNVKRTQEIVKEYLRQGYEVLYIGKKHHPEAEAVCSTDPRHIHLISSANDIPAFHSKPVFVTNQTTMSIFDIEHLFHIIRQQFPSAIFSEEICNATRVRQEAIASLEHKNIDCLFVVGDRHSNNSLRLAQMAEEKHIPHVFLIDSVQDIHIGEIKDLQRIAVTSGASTPTYLTNQVIAFLEAFAIDKAAEKPSVNIAEIL